MESAQFDMKIILIESTSVTISSLRADAGSLDIDEVEKYLKSITKN